MSGVRQGYVVPEESALDGLTNQELLACLDQLPRPPLEARRQVYERFARLHEREIHRYLAGRLRDPAAAEDVGQTTFLAAFELLEKGDRPPNPGGWLVEIAKRRVLRHIATSSGTTTGWSDDTVLGLAEASVPDRPGHDPIRTAEVHRLLPEVVSTLDAGDQELYRLRVGLGLTAAEVAQRLGQPAKTVSNKCTLLNLRIADRFHVLLLTKGDRTRCAGLRTILEQHDKRGDAYTTQLFDAVVAHYSTCPTCGDCGVCRREMRDLIRDAAPVLIPVVFAAAFHDRVTDTVQLVADATPATAPQRSPSEPPPPSPPGPARPARPRRRWARRAGVTAAVAALTVAGILVWPRTGGTADPSTPASAAMPSIAYVTDAGLQLRDGTRTPRVLAAVPPGSTVRDLVWSADGARIGWMSQPAASGQAGQIHVTDVARGTTSSSPCTRCQGLAFQAGRIVTVEDNTTLRSFAATGGTPTTLTLTGLPFSTDPAPTAASLQLLGGITNDSDLLVLHTDGTDPVNATRRLYRVASNGFVAAVFNDSVDVLPGGERDPSGLTAVSPDSQLLAYGGNTPGGDPCQPSDSATVIDLVTGSHTTTRLPADAAHPWRITGVWIGADHTVQVSAYAQPGTGCSTPQAADFSGTAAPHVFTLANGRWTDTRGSAFQSGVTDHGWTATLSGDVRVNGAIPSAPTHLIASSGTTRADLDPGATAFAWAPGRTTAHGPALGTIWSSNQQGYGMTRPTAFFNGGDPTGLVKNVKWTSWGQARAEGDGQSYFPHQSVADSTLEPVHVIAFDLGDCHGTPAYRAIGWYFPGKGQTFDPKNYINICTGEYVRP